MSDYIELYKKHRPTTWDALVGQEKVVSSLRAAVIANKLPVAFGMFGPRGSGKTSAAKILAAAINCENPSNGNPCNACNTCKNIANDSQIGVEYVSMANQGKADDVRALMDKSRLAQPVKKSVWILDEVHNLSAAAWDSMLIPLESPTAHALFILCSTEPEKIPATILTRIQQRSFGLVPADVMTNLIQEIAEKEGIEDADSAIEASVREGRGSVRETLTLFETYLSTDERPVSYGDMILDGIQSLKLGVVLKAIAEFAKTGAKSKHLGEQLFEDLRDILLLSSGAGSDLVPIAPVEDAKTFVQNVGGTAGMLFLIERVGEAVEKMSVGSADHRILLEMSLLKGINKIKAGRKSA